MLAFVILCFIATLHTVDGDVAQLPCACSLVGVGDMALRGHSGLVVLCCGGGGLTMMFGGGSGC